MYHHHQFLVQMGGNQQGEGIAAADRGKNAVKKMILQSAAQEARIVENNYNLAVPLVVLVRDQS